ncbi:von Willebrand factor A domain-containing protein 8-like [Sinocyclocheilus anshuiensis]|uniref:von Willebrand factor A domain-containing protein 8-like n=1 Tax=Sinocyclocheilus anshuiensis TaxID=1608454 RepID=UPI0007B97A76|nr:PREDICTED: von Willebrand factor A domain-containing protein 8-like [Sinocyclocheilus anshuiensis]
MDRSQLDVVDVLEGQVHTISLPIHLKAVFLVAEDRWLLVESKTDRKFLLTKPMHMGTEDTGVCQLHAISEDMVNTSFGTSSGMEATAPQEVSNEQLPSENLSTALGQKIVSPNRILCDTNTYANVIVGFSDLMSPNEALCTTLRDLRTLQRVGDLICFLGQVSEPGQQRGSTVSVLGANQVVRALPPTQVPLTEIYPSDTFIYITPPMTAAYLEVTDLNSKKLKCIPVPRSSSMSPYTVWISKVSDTDVVMAPLGSGGVVTVDIRLWETDLDNLQRSLLEWRNMIGSEDGRPIQEAEIQRVLEGREALTVWMLDTKFTRSLRRRKTLCPMRGREQHGRWPRRLLSRG